MKNNFDYLFGKLIQVNRNGRGLTVKHVAKELDLGDSYYRMIESGSARIQSKHTIQITKFLESNIYKISLLISFLSLNDDDKKTCLKNTSLGKIKHINLFIGSKLPKKEIVAETISGLTKWIKSSEHKDEKQQKRINLALSILSDIELRQEDLKQ